MILERKRQEVDLKVAGIVNLPSTSTNKGQQGKQTARNDNKARYNQLTIWFKFCCDIAPPDPPAEVGVFPPAAGAPFTWCCWDMGNPPPAPILALLGAGLWDTGLWPSPPGADISLCSLGQGCQEKREQSSTWRRSYLGVVHSFQAGVQVTKGITLGFLDCLPSAE